MTMNGNICAEKSEFSQSLTDLLDHSNTFTRKQWASFLGVSEAAISQWTQGEACPRAELLRVIVGYVRDQFEEKSELIERFETMAAKPADTVTAHARRLGSSVSDYLMKNRWQTLMARVGLMRLTQQELFFDRSAEVLQAIHAGAESVIPNNQTSSEAPAWLVTVADLLECSHEWAVRITNIASDCLQSRHNTSLSEIQASTIGALREDDEQIVGRLRINNLTAALAFFFLAHRSSALVFARNGGGTVRLVMGDTVLDGKPLDETFRIARQHFSNPRTGMRIVPNGEATSYPSISLSELTESVAA